MRDVIDDINGWLEARMPVALATVIQTWGSAPRAVGAKMAMTEKGNISGSVSGGCVEGAVFETGREVLVDKVPRLLHFGVADETAWEVGLACGGSLDVFVEPLDPVIYHFIRGLVGQEEPFAVVTIVDGPDDIVGQKLVVQRGCRIFGEISGGVDGLAAATARAALANGTSQSHKLTLPDTGMQPFQAFIEVVHAAPTLIMVGGVHIAIALTTIAKALGYQTVVVDPRRAFGNQNRFPQVDRLLQSWPDEAFRQLKLTSLTAVANLTHDPKIDDPALMQALTSPAFYVGALGNRKTHAARRERLLKAGLSKEQISRIHGPIGLDIGAQTPEEIAVAIMAEIIAANRKR